MLCAARTRACGRRRCFWAYDATSTGLGLWAVEEAGSVSFRSFCILGVHASLAPPLPPLHKRLRIPPKPPTTGLVSCAFVPSQARAADWHTYDDSGPPLSGFLLCANGVTCACWTSRVCVRVCGMARAAADHLIDLFERLFATCREGCFAASSPLCRLCAASGLQRESACSFGSRRTRPSTQHPLGGRPRDPTQWAPPLTPNFMPSCACLATGLRARGGAERMINAAEGEPESAQNRGGPARRPHAHAPHAVSADEIRARRRREPRRLVEVRSPAGGCSPVAAVTLRLPLPDSWPASCGCSPFAAVPQQKHPHADGLRPALPCGPPTSKTRAVGRVPRAPVPGPSSQTACWPKRCADSGQGKGGTAHPARAAAARRRLR